MSDGDRRVIDARLRVAVYITRDTPAGRQLLVFRHRDHSGAGTQVPAGGVEPGERLSEAAVREVREEVGEIRVELANTLAVQQRPHPVAGYQRITVFFHAETNELRDTWIHTVAGRASGADQGLVFECSFVPLDMARAVLADAQGEFVEMISSTGG